MTGPIDVELGWLSFEKGTIHRAAILDVPNFNLLAAWMQPGMTVIAGGWLVLSIRDQPIRLVSPAAAGTAPRHAAEWSLRDARSM